MTSSSADHTGVPTRPIPARRINTYSSRELAQRGKPLRVRKWKAPSRKAFNPTGDQPGATVIFEANGQRMTGQVWDKGPKRGEVWVVKDGITYLVSR